LHSELSRAALYRSGSDEARYSRTIEALQREIEVASKGWSDWRAEQAPLPPTEGGPRAAFEETAVKGAALADH